MFVQLLSDDISLLVCLSIIVCVDSSELEGHEVSLSLSLSLSLFLSLFLFLKQGGAWSYLTR